MVGMSPMVPPPEAYNKKARRKREGGVWEWRNGQRMQQQRAGGSLWVLGLQLEVVVHFPDAG